MLCLPRDVNSADGLQPPVGCLLYTSDAADDLIGVDLGGRRIIKKKKRIYSRYRTMIERRLFTGIQCTLEECVQDLPISGWVGG